MRNIRECFVKYYQSHITLLWMWIMLWLCWVLESNRPMHDGHLRTSLIVVCCTGKVAVHAPLNPRRIWYFLGKTPYESWHVKCTCAFMYSFVPSNHKVSNLCIVYKLYIHLGNLVPSFGIFLGITGRDPGGFKNQLVTRWHLSAFLLYQGIFHDLF